MDRNKPGPGKEWRPYIHPVVRWWLIVVVRQADEIVAIYRFLITSFHKHV